MLVTVAILLALVLVSRWRNSPPATWHRLPEPEGLAIGERVKASTPTGGDAGDRALAKLLRQRGAGPVRGSTIAGRVKALTRIGDWVSDQALAELLTQHGAAPHSGLSPAVDELISQVPPVTPDTPDVPAPPARWHSSPTREGWGGDTIRGGDVAAAIYGREFGLEQRPGPAGLVVVKGNRGSTDRFEHFLTEEVWLESSELVLYKGGNGLLIAIRAESPPHGEEEPDQEEDEVFLAFAPDWAPERIARWTGRAGGLRLVAGTVDGNTVYMIESPGPRKTTGPQGAAWAPGLETLWQVDCPEKTVRRVCASLPAGIDYVLSSPDGAFVATGMEPPVPGPLTCPMYILDCRSGEMVAATVPGEHGYDDRPLAWSAEVPGRLFLSRLDHGIWQLDLDVRETSGWGARK
jgi:hypothetical protein